jgi:hypothetical protein
VFCTKKQLAFRDERPLSVIQLVDTRGEVTVFEDPARNFYQSYINMMVPNDITVDRKGFFGFKFMINQEGQVIIRYKNK